MNQMQRPTLKMKLWLENNGEMAFGAGSALLLREIANTGSLAGAARVLNMSYRAAWGRLKKVESRLGFDLVGKKGGNKSGYHLTEEGEKLLVAYEGWSLAVKEIAREKAEEFFPWHVETS